MYIFLSHFIVTYNILKQVVIHVGSDDVIGGGGVGGGVGYFPTFLLSE